MLVEQGQTIGEEQLILLRLEHEAAVKALGFGDRVRRALGILALVAALFVLTGYYARRHEVRFVRDPRKIALICGLVVMAPAAVRLLSMQTWDAELVPVAIAAMIVAIAYNPNFALMVTFTLSLLDLRRAGDGPRPLPRPDGRDRRGRADAHRGPHPHQADQGRRHGRRSPTSS